MVKFSDCFRFSHKEVKQSYENAAFFKKLNGIKVLKVNLSPSSQQKNHGKVLIVVPKFCGKAHQRNLFKRQIKAIFYQNKLYQKLQNLILIASARALTLSFHELEQTLLTIFSSSES